MFEPVTVTTLIGVGLIFLKQLKDLWREHRGDIHVEKIVCVSDCCGSSGNKLDVVDGENNDANSKESKSDGTILPMGK